MTDPGYIPITLLYAPIKGLSPLVDSVVVTHESPTPVVGREHYSKAGACYVTVTLTNGFALKHTLDPEALRLPERVSAGQVKFITYLVMELIETLNRIERDK